jgi:anti-sigma B factor antagonist
MDLGLEVTAHDGVPVLVVRGEVDVATAPRFRQAIVELAAEGSTSAIVDLEGVDFLDSTGLGVLVSGLKRFRTMGGDLLIICTQRRILRVFEITRLDRAFSVFASRGEAVAAIAGPRS